MPVSDFKTAYTEVRNLAAQPSQDQQLDLYAYAKIAQKENIEDKKVGMFNIKEKTMKNHWQKKLDEGVTPEQAEKKYVDLVNDLQKSLGTK